MDSYAIFAILLRPELPGGALVASLSQWTWVPVFAMAVTFLLLLFPDGHLLSPRWRWFAWVTGVDLVVVSRGDPPGTRSDRSHAARRGERARGAGIRVPLLRLHLAADRGAGVGGQPAPSTAARDRHRACPDQVAGHGGGDRGRRLHLRAHRELVRQLVARVAGSAAERLDRNLRADPGRDRCVGAALPVVRHRCRDPQGGGHRPARRVHHDGVHRDRRRPRRAVRRRDDGEPRLVGRGGCGGRARVPTRSPVGAPGVRPRRLRQAGDPLRGADRVRRSARGFLRRGRRARADGPRPGRGARRRAGSCVARTARIAAGRRDLARRRPRRRRRSHRAGAPSRRGARRPVGRDAGQRSDGPGQGEARRRSRRAGRAGAAQRRADRGAAATARGTAGGAAPARHRAGPGATATRAQHPRRRAAAAGGAEREDAARPGDARARSRPRRPDARGAAG